MQATTSASAFPRPSESLVRTVLRIDAAFELLLGLALVTAPATGLKGWLALPAPMDANWAYIALGVALIFAAVAIFEWSRHPAPAHLLALALLNDAGGILFAVWLIVQSGFTTQGTVAVIGVIAALFTLSTAQFLLWALSRR